MTEPPDARGQPTAAWDQRGAVDTRTRAPGGVPDPTERVESGPLPDIPGYEITGELGRGGMGVVYHARQHGLNRVVALKMVLAGAHAEADQLVRFLAEAETAARLHHHGIAQVFDSGRAAGFPYFTMEYVAGGSLADRLAAGPVPPADAARVALQLAEAVAHAHTAGVAHRDLKPANILLTADGAPKITDFGLAKRLEAGDGLTRTGSILGTPAYMPPEQARGDLKAVGPLGDVYALGAVLYEMLTGRPPFRSSSPVNTLSLVLNAAPERPRAVNAAVPRDLETIALKCLEKQPGNRYPSAEALAGDLRRFLDGRTILARRTGAAEKLRRWAKRNPAVAALLAAVFLSLTAGIGVSSVLAVRAGNNAEQARKEKERADRSAAAAREAERERTEQLWRSLTEQARAGRTSGRVGQRFDGLAALRQAAAIRPILEIRNEAIACLALVDIRPNPEGILTPKQVVVPSRTHPDGLRLRHKNPNTLQVLDLGGTVMRELTHPAVLYSGSSVAWSPDGRLLAVGCEDTAIHVWRIPEGERQTVLHGCTAVPFHLSFDPTGRFLCSHENGGAVRLWDPVTGTPLVWSGRPGTPFRFDTGGRLTGRPGAPVWELATDRECRVLHHSVTGARDGAGPLRRGWSARFDRAGRRVVTCGGEYAFWDTGTGAEVHRVDGPNGTQVAVLADGSWLAARDREIFRWPAGPPFEPQGEPLYALHPNTLQSPRHEVGGVTPDGKWVVVADPGADRAALVPLAGGEPVVLEQPRAYDTALSPDGTLVAVGSLVPPNNRESFPVRVWEVPSGRLVRELPRGGYSRVAFTPDGRWLVVGTGSAYEFWRVGTWEPGLRIPRRGTDGTGVMAFSPDGRLMACLPEPLTLRLLDPATGAEVATLTPPTLTSFEDLCFSPDGTRLVVSTGTGVMHLWDLRLVRRQLRGINLDWDPPME